MKYTSPSRIQGLAIPAILKNPPQNFIGQAQSGTGKTAAFSLSILARVNENDKSIQAVILAPTRELSRQIHDVISKLATFTKIKSLLVVPEADIPKNLDHHVIVGTPGKVFSLATQKKTLFAKVRMFVLDEADEMLRLQGLKDQSIKIQRKIPKDCQVCLFSATYDKDVAAFANTIISDPKVKIEIPPEKLTLDKLAQFYIDCGKDEERYRVLDEIYASFNVGQSIIFVQTRDTAKKLTHYMRERKHEVSVLHGADMEPKERDRVIDSFRSGATRVLITTNVLARGVDVLQVSLVVNFDVPVDGKGNPDPETYLHRIGRSARYGNSGVAINFVFDSRSKQVLDYISKHYNKKIEQLPIDKLEQVAKLLDDLV